MLAALKSPNAHLRALGARYFAQSALGEFENTEDSVRLISKGHAEPRAIDPLLALLHDADPEVSMQAIFALSAIKTPRATQPLLALLQQALQQMPERTATGEQTAGAPDTRRDRPRVGELVPFYVQALKYLVRPGVSGPPAGATARRKGRVAQRRRGDPGRHESGARPGSAGRRAAR